MTDEQRRRGHDIEVRAEPLFRELARVEENIRHLRQKLNAALDERDKIETRLALLSEEKSAWWKDVFASMEV